MQPPLHLVAAAASNTPVTFKFNFSGHSMTAEPHSKLVHVCSTRQRHAASIKMPFTVLNRSIPAVMRSGVTTHKLPVLGQFPFRSGIAERQPLFQFCSGSYNAVPVNHERETRVERERTGRMAVNTVTKVILEMLDEMLSKSRDDGDESFEFEFEYFWAYMRMGVPVEFWKEPRESLEELCINDVNKEEEDVEYIAKWADNYIKYTRRITYCLRWYFLRIERDKQRLDDIMEHDSFLNRFTATKMLRDRVNQHYTMLCIRLGLLGGEEKKFTKLVSIKSGERMVVDPATSVILEKLRDMLEEPGADNGVISEQLKEALENMIIDPAGKEKENVAYIADDYIRTIRHRSSSIRSYLDRIVRDKERLEAFMDDCPLLERFTACKTLNDRVNELYQTIFMEFGRFANLKISIIDVCHYISDDLICPYPNPNFRLKAKEVIQHPLLWDSDKRMSFFQDASDRVQTEVPNSQLLNTLQGVALGGNCWNGSIDSVVLKELQRRRQYDFNRVRDLLRVIRNISHHYYELSVGSRTILGSFPEGVDAYFSTRFPDLFIGVYTVILNHSAQEVRFHKYFRTEILSEK